MSTNEPIHESDEKKETVGGADTQDAKGGATDTKTTAGNGIQEARITEKNASDGNEEIPRSKCREFSHFVRLDQWLVLAESDIDMDDLNDRLNNHWTTIASISGLTTGFTYVVSNSEVEFTVDGYISHQARENLFGFMCIIAFLCALFSTLVAAGLYGLLNMVGKTQVKWFITNVWYLCDMPFVLCFVSIICMLISAMFSVGGLYSGWVYWSTASVGGVGVVVGFIWFAVMENMCYKRIEYMKANPPPKKERQHYRQDSDDGIQLAMAHKVAVATAAGL